MKLHRIFDNDIVLIGLLAVLALAGAVLVSINVTEHIPHIEDEITYLFQARTLAHGALVAPVQPARAAFFTPFVVTIQNHRVGKYPIGWPLLLAIGEALGAGWLVAPILGAATVALIYCTGRDLVDRQIGAMAGLLAATSPFFLITSSTYMSHAASAFWAALLGYSFLHKEKALAAGRRGRLPAIGMGIAIGMLALTRPLTAVGVTVPFTLLIAIRIIRQPRDVGRLVKAYWPTALAAVFLASWQPLILWAATGSPTTNLYTMIWPYDRIGFGPGHGVLPEGHSLAQALYNARRDLTIWATILFGWRYLSWLPMIPGVIFTALEVNKEHRGWAFLLPAALISLVGVYLTYWIGSASGYGPRYYYEALSAMCLLAAIGLRGSMRFLVGAVRRVRQHEVRSMLRSERVGDLLAGTSRAAVVVVVLAILGNVLLYLPDDLRDRYGTYDITAEPIHQIETLAGSDRVVVLVQGGFWFQYAALFSLNSPWYDTQIVVVHDMNLATRHAVLALYPDRTVWYSWNEQFSRTPFPYEESTQP